MASAIFEAQRADMRRITGPLIDLSQIDRGEDFVVIRGIAPAGSLTPLHSHADRETMVIIEGTMTAWLAGEWRSYGPGEIIEVAPGVRHALRNDGSEDVAMVLVTTGRMARFFSEISTTQADAAVTPERLAHFERTVAAYGYWTGGPEDQAAIGISLPGMLADAEGREA